MSAKARHMHVPLTSVQKRYLRFIDRYAQVHGVAPSFADIEHALCVTSPSAHRMVLALEKRGALARVPGRARSLQLLLPPEAFADDPVEATAPAGSPGYLRDALRKPIDADGAAYHLAVALGILRSKSKRGLTANHLFRQLRPILAALLAALVNVGVVRCERGRYS